MPMAAPRPCTAPGCRLLVRDGHSRCDAHRREAEARRGSSTQRGYGSKWQQAREGYLRLHPLCQCPDCDEGRLQLTAAEVVDHKIPHGGDMVLFWDRDNWQALAKVCHDRKTATHDGGFGRPAGQHLDPGGGQMFRFAKR